MNQDLLTGMFIGGGLAAIMHYLNMVVLAWRVKRAEADIAKMIVEHALKGAKK